MFSRLAYTGLYYLLTPLMFIRLLLKHRKSSAYKEQRQALRLAERLGFFSVPDDFSEKKNSRKPVWIHTVSVGEFLASLPLIKQIMQETQLPLVITCTTTTGSAQIIKTFDNDIRQGRVLHVYLPYDLPGSMRRFFHKVRPGLGIVMETEIWPNMMQVAQQAGVPVWLLNARMSAKSAKGYARFKQLTQMTLQSFSGIAAQDGLDANRLKELGANHDALHITGSIKFDLKVNPDDIEAGKALRVQLGWQDKTVLMVASTHKGEDEILLDTYQQLKEKHPDLVMLVVPRHPERFEFVFQLLNSKNYSVLRRSQIDQVEQETTDILLGDSMGEMMRYFACADLVFMGGTLVPTGGHNILEPAALGLPIVYGPHIFNFYAINELFQQYEASLQVNDVELLPQTIDSLINESESTREMGERAKHLMEQNSGALDKMMALIRPYLN